MAIKIYNTLTRETDEFKPQNKNEVSMYNCGPTVYDVPHIGNFRTFVMADIARRVLEYNGYKVRSVMNITDIDDKTIKRSAELKISLQELTRKYETEFLKGLESLNIIRPEILRATENIGEMISLINVLLEKGLAYKADDGVYMHVDKIANYGELARLKMNGKTAERIVNDEYNKDDPRDFSLWKFKTDNDGQAFYDAPFGKGRPGWHIECSAMSMKVFGPSIDIHTGGSDLIFPHHTNEIAQSESATGKKFVYYWMHGAFMNVSDEKMSKSKNNFTKLEDLKDESISPLSFRYWLMTGHYRSVLNFTFENVQAGQTALIKLMSAISSYPDGGKIISEYKEKFISMINNDFNTPEAIALTWELVKDLNIKPEDKKATILDFDKVFGLKLDTIPLQREEPIPAEIIALSEAREEARKNKEWDKADALRNEIEDRGYEVNDTASGAKISVKTIF